MGFLPDSHPHKLMINYSMINLSLYSLYISMLSLHKIGCISANNGPIWKIQNLARSGPRCRSVWCHNDVVRDVTREMTSHACEDVSSDVIIATITLVAMGRCYGPISLTVGRIWFIFGRQTDMAKIAWHTKDRHHSPIIKETGWFLSITMATVWFPWKPIALW